MPRQFRVDGRQPFPNPVMEEWRVSRPESYIGALQRPGAGILGTSLDSDWYTLLRPDGRLLRDVQARPGRQQQLNGIGDVFFGDVVIASLDAE